MKRNVLLAASIIPLLIFCCNKSQIIPNDAEKEEKSSVWESFEDKVFPTPKEDTAYSIPDYVYSTDWMQRYVQFIKKNFEGGEDYKWRREGGGDFFDCKYWSLAYVDSDTIPEMLLYGGCWASASIILTQYNGKVYESPNGMFMFIEGGKGLLHSQLSHSDEIWGAVYEINNGRFNEKVNYYCFNRHCDTAEIEKYGLNRDSLSILWLTEDGTVEICGVKVNGEVVDVNYGYCNWPSSYLHSIMDSLYYSKGSSILFPRPMEPMTIGELLNANSFLPRSLSEAPR